MDENTPTSTAKSPSFRNYILVILVLAIVVLIIIALLINKDSTSSNTGIRNDNAIENLELWVKPQPSVVRASDALKWAEKILTLYAPINNKL